MSGGERSFVKRSFVRLSLSLSVCLSLCWHFTVMGWCRRCHCRWRRVPQPQPHSVFWLLRSFCSVLFSLLLLPSSLSLFLRTTPVPFYTTPQSTARVSAIISLLLWGATGWICRGSAQTALHSWCATVDRAFFPPPRMVQGESPRNVSQSRVQ